MLCLETNGSHGRLKLTTTYQTSCICCSYYEGLQKCVGLAPGAKVYTSEEVEKLTKLYSELREKFPRSAAAKVWS